MIEVTLNGLLHGEREISNFVPRVERIYRESGNDTHFWAEIVVEQCQTSEDSAPTSIYIGLVSCDEVEHLKFGRYSPAFLCMDADGNSTEREVRAYLRSEIARKVCECGVIFTRCGWHSLPNGEHVYLAGDRLIGNTAELDYKIAPELMAISLNDLPNLSDREIVSHFLRGIKEEPDILVPIVAHTIRSMLASCFDEAGYPIRYALYVYGQQGLGKTTTVRNFSLPFSTKHRADEAVGLIDVKSTEAALKDELVKLIDQSVVLDDVAICTDPSEQRHRKAIAGNILRFAANEAKYQKKGWQAYR